MSVAKAYGRVGVRLLGQDVVEQKLVVNKDEATRVRVNFDFYLECKGFLLGTISSENMPLSNREVLEVFVESVDDLLESKYLQQAKAGGVGSSVSITRGIGFVMGRSGPDRDSVKAVLLTIRFFCQNNERISLENMDTLIQSLLVAQDLKDRFTKSRAEFNLHLRSAPVVGYPAGIGADTNGDIFDTFLYGTFAHANPDKRRTVKAWEQQPYYNDLRSQFDLTLLSFISCVVVMGKIVKEILDSGAAV